MSVPCDELNVPPRVLLGPGPSEMHPRVLRSLATPLLGHLDPAFLDLMERVKELLRWAFQTQNRLTFPLSGTGTAGMEACLCNLLEPGERILVCVNGYFGNRIVDIAERCGAEVMRVDREWGKAIDPGSVAEALKTGPFKVVAIVHAETSTGVLQPLEEISHLTHESGALLLVDAVTSLGGVPVKVDEWSIDAVYSGSQKCLSAPPGMAPVSFSEAAVETIRQRKRKVQSFYLDMTLIDQYYGTTRAYHHTAPISMVYALYEGLRVAHEEGHDLRAARHRLNHLALAAGVEAMGLALHSEKEHRLWMLNTVTVPEGVDDVDLRKSLLQDYGIEVGGGLGDLKGKVLRVGLMGYGSNRRNVLLFLSALEALLSQRGCKINRGAAAAAATGVYTSSSV
ncbi:MAG: alanine--glyoxylate aminotransferase family protein [Armatimonadetes bacterium]|nr:alanine--glyoxylate aminotransferase family protein [Armatimonadota bacterium]